MPLQRSLSIHYLLLLIMCNVAWGACHSWLKHETPNKYRSLEHSKRTWFITIVINQGNQVFMAQWGLLSLFLKINSVYLTEKSSMCRNLTFLIVCVSSRRLQSGRCTSGTTSTFSASLRRTSTRSYPSCLVTCTESPKSTGIREYFNLDGVARRVTNLMIVRPALPKSR